MSELDKQANEKVIASENSQSNMAPASFDETIPHSSESLTEMIGESSELPKPAPKVPSFSKRFFTMLLALLSALCSFFLLGIAALVLMYFNVATDLATQFSAAVLVLPFVLALGGKRLLHFDKEDVLHSFKLARGLIIVSALATIMAVSALIASGAHLPKSFLIDLVTLILISLSVGVYEELLFRGLLFHGLLALGGKSKLKMGICVFISAILFGSAHILLTGANLTDPVQLAQAVMKIVQTGIIGFVLSVASLHKQSVVGPILVHASFDFVSLISILFTGIDLDVKYVNTGADAYGTLIYYVILVALYIPSVVRAYREFKNVPSPNYGAFLQATPDKNIDLPEDPDKSNELPVYPA